MDKTNLGNRIKSYEEWGSSARIMTKCLPIIIRVDGKNFSSWTKNLNKPFEGDLITAFSLTAKRMMKEYLTESVIAYGQSDEVSFLLRPAAPYSDSQFGGKRDKLNSITASAFTAIFNEERLKYNSLSNKKSAIFDARTFSLPSVTEATNALVWRQQDAIRNSISSVAQVIFSHKELQGKNSAERLDMMEKAGVVWSDLPLHLQRGWSVIRKTQMIEPDDILMLDIPREFRPVEPVERRVLAVDLKIPVFSKTPNYIYELVEIKKED